MTVRLVGKIDLDRALRALPAKLEQTVLRGAARAGANVIAAEARAQSASEDVAAAIKVNVRATPGEVVATVYVDEKAKGAFVAPWLENGTEGHFITVSEEDRQGRSIRRINDVNREAARDGGSLVIGGNFVGPSVWHPGARPHPFLRPAFDTKQGDALDAMGAHATQRLARGGIDVAEPAAEE